MLPGRHVTYLNSISKTFQIHSFRDNSWLEITLCSTFFEKLNKDLLEQQIIFLSISKDKILEANIVILIHNSFTRTTYLFDYLY